MALKIDFSDIRDNQKVFHVTRGMIKIEKGVSDTKDKVFTDADNAEYFSDGKEYDDDKHPSFFHSIEECIEYFQSVKKDMDEESKPKKRYWIWDVKHGNGTIGKTEIYLDEKGFSTANCLNPYYTNFEPMKIKKHENEFIDV